MSATFSDDSALVTDFDVPAVAIENPIVPTRANDLGDRMILVPQAFNPEITTPLGEDTLLFRSLQGREELGRLSKFEISALSTRADIDPADLLGKKVTVKVELRHNMGYPYFNGYVVRFAQGAMVGRYYEYRMTVHPWLWFLTRTTDCRIFEDKTVREIIVDVFQDDRHHGFPDYDDQCTSKYATREYCVQYRETDFDFVSRLMEEEGIYYYFDHCDGRHILKLVDSDSGHKPLEHKATIPFHPPGYQARVDEEYIHAWSFDQSIQPGLVELKDYDFTNPKADLTVKNKKSEKHEHAEYEIFDWPGEYHETSDGEHLVSARVDELHAEFERSQAACNARDIAVGRLFTLTNFPRRDQDREYLIVSADWELVDNPYETAPDQPATYRATFTAMQSKQQFRPARLTPRPTVKGIHSAVVVGPAGEEIYTDKYGRVKVQFHWDRYGKRDENSSCWIRVSHPWAGKGWGAVAIPRIGQEVIVDFLEGDPDQPLITGRVYNGDNMPPYGLPPAAVISGIKSNTHKGKGYNELSMDDTAGKEKITIHAQYDMNTTVEHDQTSEIKNNRSAHVVVNDTVNVDADRRMHVKGKLTETVDAGQDVTVSSGYKETISGGATRTIDGGHSENVTGKRTMTVTGPIDQSATSTIDIHATGAGTYTSDAALKFVVAGSVIEVTPDGVTHQHRPVDGQGRSVWRICERSQDLA
jgi:type VI secretion system secreted protein VgrG